jgi:hypothetical protein
MLAGSAKGPLASCSRLLKVSAMSLMRVCYLRLLKVKGLEQSTKREIGQEASPMRSEAFNLTPPTKPLRSEGGFSSYKLRCGKEEVVASFL